MISLLVDDRQIQAEEGANLLQSCLDNDIYIPNLCFVRGMDEPPVSCRLCFVEIEGESKPVPSCAIRVRDGMEVRTDTPAVRRLQKSAFQLLMSVHEIDPRCPVKKQCELVRIARFLKIGLTPGKLEKILREKPTDDTHPYFTLHLNRCVLCGKCSHICRKIHGQQYLTFARRGFDTVISFYGSKTDTVNVCKDCAACVRICPVGALTKKEQVS